MPTCPVFAGLVTYALKCFPQIVAALLPGVLGSSYAINSMQIGLEVSKSQRLNYSLTRPAGVQFCTFAGNFVSLVKSTGMPSLQIIITGTTGLRPQTWLL